jgi:hypothetical protein
MEFEEGFRGAAEDERDGNAEGSDGARSLRHVS